MYCPVAVFLASTVPSILCARYTFPLTTSSTSRSTSDCAPDTAGPA